MQKKFITLLLALLGFSMVIEAKSINTYGFTIGAGQTREFYIYMNTTLDNLVSFQIDLIMPEGLKVNVDQCTLPARVKDKEQMLFVGKLDGNKYRFVSTSYSLTALSKEDAPLLKVSVTADNDFQGGKVDLVDMFAVSSVGRKVEWISDAFDVATTKVVRGDTNYDSEVTVSDVMTVVNYMLGKETLFSSTYDLDSNNVVDIVDVMTCSNLLLESIKVDD